MALAYKVAGNSRRSGGVSQQPVVIENPWEPWYAWRPKRINERWYWFSWVYRRFVISPGGGYWKYGDDFDYMRWQP